LVFGINSMEAIAAMVLGIATWSVGFALLTAWEGCAQHLEPGRAWRRALMWGLTLRVLLVLVVIPDFWAGICSMGLVDNVLRAVFWDEPGSSSAFSRVYLITLLQGMWVAGTLLALTGVIRCFLRDDEKAVASQGGCSDAAPL
jgi:hypothetical protein